MKKIKQVEEPEIGLITKSMDTKSDDYKKLQAIILNQVQAQSKEERLKTEMLALKIKMQEYLKMQTDTVISCGEFLKAYLTLLNVSQKHFAIYTGIDASLLSKIINGDRPLSPEFAIIIAEIFESEALLWLEIQAKNELLAIKPTSKNKKYSLEGLLGMNS